MFRVVLYRAPPGENLALESNCMTNGIYETEGFLAINLEL